MLLEDLEAENELLRDMVKAHLIKIRELLNKVDELQEKVDQYEWAMGVGDARIDSE